MTEYTENTEILLLTAENRKGFLGMIDFATGKKFTWAFTSQEKAKEFIVLGRNKGYLKDTNILYRCTIDEFLDKEKQSHLTIDPNGKEVWDYAGWCGDATKEDIKVVKYPQGDTDIYLVEKTKRKE